MEKEWIRRGLLALSLTMALGCLTAMLLPVTKAPAAVQSSMPSEDVALPPETTDQTSRQSAAKSHLYELGIWQGNVAVFSPGESQPLQVLETPVSALPLPDQQALARRIPVMTEPELASLLEDYSS